MLWSAAPEKSEGQSTAPEKKNSERKPASLQAPKYDENHCWSACSGQPVGLGSWHILKCIISTTRDGVLSNQILSKEWNE